MHQHVQDILDMAPKSTMAKTAYYEHLDAVRCNDQARIDANEEFFFSFCTDAERAEYKALEREDKITSIQVAVFKTVFLPITIIGSLAKVINPDGFRISNISKR